MVHDRIRMTMILRGVLLCIRRTKNGWKTITASSIPHLLGKEISGGLGVVYEIKIYGLNQTRRVHTFIKVWVGNTMNFYTPVELYGRHYRRP